MNCLTILAIAATAFAFTAMTGPAEAVVYCKTVGVPKGCVMRPTPVVRAPVVRASRVNLGGPVNRVGVR